MPTRDIEVRTAWTSAGDDGPDHAIIVGIDAYPGLTALHGAECDARAFEAWVTSADGGAVAPANVELIVSSQFEPAPDIYSTQPMVSTVEAAFRRLADRVLDESATIGRRLYVFLAGHGFTRHIDQSLLLTAEANERQRYHIPGVAYANWFVDNRGFAEVVLFMDCCSGRYTKPTVRQVEWEDRQDPVRHSRRVFGFAADVGETARERFFASIGATRGVFSKALIDGLSGRASDAYGRVTSQSLAGYVRHEVPLLAQGQMPRFTYEPDDAELILAAARPALTRVAIHGSEESCFRVMSGATAEPVGDASRGGQWFDVVPTDRLYWVEETTGRARRGPFEVRGTDPVELELEEILRGH